jgi:hypothetical protein
MATTRTLHLIEGVAASRALLLSGQPVGVRVTERKGRTEAVEFYWISRPHQDNSIWWVAKESPNDDEPLLYDVDTSFGPDPATMWDCSHPLVRGFSGTRSIGCRHCCAVGKLLELLV